MGLLKSIGNALKPLAKKAGLDKISGVISRGVSFVNKIASPLTRPLSKLVDRLPLPQVVKSFAQGILENPAALLTAAALGPVGAFLQGALPAQLAPLAQLIASSPAATGEGLTNAAILFAKEQARDVLAREAAEQLREIAA